MRYVLWFSRPIVLFCICSIILANVAFSARLVDSDDDGIESQSNTAPTEEQEAEINKLLLMKKLLNVRNRARALASTTFGTQRASVDTKNPKIEAMDLHTAYRLPLHRLSDTQLQLLLQKYDDNFGNGKQLSRPEMITKLQELITKDEKMLRPRLLTNINIMTPNDLALHEPVVEESEISRTTIGPTSTYEVTRIGIETTRQSFLINNDNDDLESTQPTITELPTTENPSTDLPSSTENPPTEISSTEIPSILENSPIPEIPSAEIFTNSEIPATSEIPSISENPSTPEIPIDLPSTEIPSVSENPSTSEIPIDLPSTEIPISLSSNSETPSTIQPHKQIPMDIEPPKLHGNNDEEFEKHMREKNNRLHSQYIASLSEDLQRLKAKYDIMKLEFLRTLRRINERNVNRANNPLSANKLSQFGAPTFIPNKDSSFEPIEDSKSGILSPKLDANNDTSIESPTQSLNQTEKPLGAERIETEILANRESFKTFEKAKQLEEVDPSTVVSENPDLDRGNHQEIINFFKSDEQQLDLQNKTHDDLQNTTQSIDDLQNTTQSVVESTTTTLIDEGLEDKEFEVITENLPINETTTEIVPVPTIGRVIHKLEKLVEQQPISHPSAQQQISTVELEKLDDKTPKKFVKVEVPTTTIVSNEELTTPSQESEDKPLTVMEAMNEIEAKIMSPVSWSEATKENKSKLMEPKIHFKLKRIDELVTAADLIDRLQHEAVENKTSIKESCRRVSCDFEEGNLCQWKSSLDKLNLSTRKYLVSNRRRRQAPYITRGWHTWQGKFSSENSTIDKSDIFSSENKQFIATYLKPQQKAILTAKLPQNNQTIVIDFDIWEATRNMQLKFCCDTLKTCVFQTEIGLKRGTRKWLSRQAICPVGTSRVLFECMNEGNYQGACGIDNIKLADEECPISQTAKTYLLDGGEKQQQ